MTSLTITRHLCDRCGKTVERSGADLPAPAGWADLKGHMLDIGTSGLVCPDCRTAYIEFWLAGPIAASWKDDYRREQRRKEAIRQADTTEDQP